MKYKNILISLFILVLVLFTVYSIHINYFLPFHSEELDHLNLAKESLDGNWEIGFTILYKTLNSLLLNNLNQLLVFIPVIFGLIISFSSFILGRHLFRNSLAGLLSAVFVLLIPSSPAVMGLWFAVPNSLALALTPILLYFFLKGTANKKHGFLFIFLFLSATIIHPAFTLILIPIIAVYLFLNPKTFERNQLKIAIALIALILIFPFFASRLGLQEVSFSHNTFASISENINKVIVWKAITHYAPKFYLTDFLGIYLLFLAGIGTGLIIMMRALIEIKRKKRQQSLIEKEFTVSKHQIILPLGLIILSALYLHFHLKNYTFIVPYERMYLSLMLFLALSAGAGFYLIWKTLKNKLKKEILKPFAGAGIILILFFVLTVPFAQKSELYKNIETSGIPAVNWINEFTPKNSSFIAIPSHSLIIKSFTERKIFASPPTRAGIPDDFQLEIFFIQNCTNKKETIQKTKANYIFTEKEIECSSFNKIYDKKDYKIYKILKP